MRIEVVGARHDQPTGSNVRRVPGVRGTDAVRGCRESPAGSRGTAPAGPWSRLRQRRLQRDGCIGRSGLHSDTSNRSPRLRCDQPRGRTYQNHGGDRTGRRPHLRVRPTGDETMRYCVVPCASPCYGWCEVLDTGRGMKRAEHVKSRPVPTNRGRSRTDRHRASSSRLPSPSIAPSGRNRG